MSDKIVGIFSDPDLGDFKCVEYNSKLQCWIGQARTTDDRPFELIVSWRSPAEWAEPKIDASTKSRLRDFIAREMNLRKDVAERTFSTAENWADPETLTEPLTLESYRAALFPTSVDLSADDEIVFYYEEDQDIFAGHTIMVVVNNEGEIRRADLAG